MLSLRWAGARGGVWASAWKTLCWPSPHAGAGGGFEGVVEHLGTCPCKDLAAGSAGCRQRCRGSCAAQGCRSPGTGHSTGLGCTVSLPGHGQRRRAGVHSAITKGYVCVCARAHAGACEHVCAWLGMRYMCPPTPVHGCEHGGVCLGVCACGYPVGVQLGVCVSVHVSGAGCALPAGGCERHHVCCASVCVSNCGCEQCRMCRDGVCACGRAVPAMCVREQTRGTVPWVTLSSLFLCRRLATHGASGASRMVR